MVVSKVYWGQYDISVPDTTGIYAIIIIMNSLQWPVPKIWQENDSI